MSIGWQAIPAFIVAVGVLVTVHEFGHFWVARRLGFKVLRFSIGFGRALWTHVGKDRTEYVIAAVPLGGYVKMLDEREGPVAPEERERSFNRRPHWQRIVVLLAGPAFNFAFAIVLLTGMFIVSGATEVRPVIGTVTAGSRAAGAGLRAGDEFLAIDGRRVSDTDAVVLGLIDGVSGEGRLPVLVRGGDGIERALTLEVDAATERRALSDAGQLLDGVGFHFVEPPIPPVLGAVDPGGPAARAGLQTGDTVLSVDGAPVKDFQSLVQLIRARPGGTVDLRVRRGANELRIAVPVAADTDKGQTIGRIRVSQPPRVAWPEGMLRHVDLGPIAALSRAGAVTWDLTAFQGRMLWRMLTGSVSVRNISGPLTIAQMAGESAVAGVSPFLRYLVLISLALGFMNLLPIPILDGGQVVLQAIEWLKGSPLSDRAQAAGQQVGILLVMLLLGLALFNDIARQFG